MKNVESKLQIACVKWFRLQYRRYELLLNSVPNGGARSAVTGAIIKAEGSVRGVADLELNIARGGWHGMKIEMKTTKGRQSEWQKAWQQAVEAQGYKYVVCRSLEEFIVEVTSYMNLSST